MHGTETRPGRLILIKFLTGGFNKKKSSHVKFNLYQKKIIENLQNYKHTKIYIPSCMHLQCYSVNICRSENVLLTDVVEISNACIIYSDTSANEDNSFLDHIR